MPSIPHRRVDEHRLAGKYVLLRRLAAGDRDELFLAQASGPLGFEKLVVIKRLLAQHARTPDSQKEFAEQARLASSMSHPNLVQCFDLGESDEGLFMVLEFTGGQDLRSVMRTMSSRHQPAPVDFALHVAISVAEVLSYAHQLSGAGGRPLHLVHRHLTPTTIFVTWDGVVKLESFGIAPASSRKDHRAYQAPEQIRSKSIDGRVDQFALGAILFELLTGRRMFDSDDEPALANSILGPARPRPSATRTDLPQQLDHIVQRATALSPTARYPSMSELRDELGSVRRLGGPLAVVSQDPAQVMRHLFPTEFGAHRLLLTELPRASQEERQRLLEAALATPPPHDDGALRAPPAAEDPVTPRSGAREQPVATVRVAASSAPTARVVINSHSPAREAPLLDASSGSVTVVDDRAREGPEVVLPPVELPRLAPVTSPPPLSVSSPKFVAGGAEEEPRFKRLAIGAAVVGVLMLAVWAWPARKPPLPPGVIEVSSEPTGASVVLDGVPQNWKTPLVISHVAFGQHELTLSHPDTQDARHTVQLSKEVPEARVRVDLAGKRVALQVSTIPAVAKVSVDGRDVPGRSPFTVEGMQLDQRYEVQVSASGYHSETRSVSPADGPVTVRLIRIAGDGG